MDARTPDQDLEPLDDSKRTRCEIWTRVMGYHRPVSQWNIGKQAEHKTRKLFVEPKPAAASGAPDAGNPASGT